MNKWILALVVVLAISVPAWASDKKQNAGGGSTEDQVKALTEQNRDAALNANTAWMEKHLDAGYMAVNSNGSVSTREEVIQRLKSGALKYEAIDIQDQKVHVFGNTAVVDSAAHVKLTNDGQPIDGDFRATHVWVKEAGNWKLVSFQATPVRPAASAATKK